MRFDDVDLAAIDPCPSCGTPTRRMGGIPIAGSGLDLVFSKAWHCDACLQAKCDAAMAGIDRSIGAPLTIETGALL